MPAARAASSAMSDVVRSNGACSWSMTTKSKPASPMISVAWPVGVFRKRADQRLARDQALAERGGGRTHDRLFDVLCRLRHRIIVGIQHPAGLLREVDARRAEDVDELVFAAADRFRRVDRRRRDDGDRGRAAQLVIVGAPEVLVRSSTASADGGRTHPRSRASTARSRRDDAARAWWRHAAPDRSRGN